MSNDIGIIGLGTMGGNIARNFAHHGFQVSVYNRTYAKTEELLQYNEPNIHPFKAVEDLIASLKTPKIVFLMVTDSAVDAVANPLVKMLHPGDIIIDGGNSHWKNTDTRQSVINPTGIHFVGLGVSGGEEGALNGPSMMFGGEPEDWEKCKHLLEPISAKTSNGEPCVEYLGKGSAGHFVKMVHNAIEYSDMQLIAETYDILRKLFHLNNDQIADIFHKWNQTVLESYLIEITEDVLRFKEGDRPIVDLILDRAAQKGTGKWAAQDSFDFNIPTPGFCEAVTARIVSSMKDERVEASRNINLRPLDTKSVNSVIPITIDDLEKGLYAAKIACYAQGLAMIQSASTQHNYGIDIAACARVWRGGCIIRARFLTEIAQKYTAGTKNLMLIGHFKQELEERIQGWRKIVAVTALESIPAPLYSSTLAYVDSYASEKLPANLIQGLRDFFGAHTYERVDKPGHFHTKWLEDNQ